MWDSFRWPENAAGCIEANRLRHLQLCPNLFCNATRAFLEVDRPFQRDSLLMQEGPNIAWFTCTLTEHPLNSVILQPLPKTLSVCNITTGHHEEVKSWQATRCASLVESLQSRFGFLQWR